MKPTELAYAAGVIDSDGSIGINRWYQKGTYYKVVIQVGMRKSDIPEWLHLIVGGGLGRYTITTTYTPDRKPWYKWMITGKKAKELCIDLLPYLIEKKRHAMLIPGYPINEKGQKFTEGENELREILWRIIREYNQ